MDGHVLITGSCGLVGSALALALQRQGEEPLRLDIRGTGSAQGDVRDPHKLREVLAGARGVVHLGAVSRVVWAERDPAACWSTNVDGLRTLLSSIWSISERPDRPWCVFASSREVYGESPTLPVREETPLAPLNVYARSKVAGERLIAEARASGLRAATVRLSNVYGSAQDHHDRVVPAFIRAALAGRALRLEGRDNTFDFTHVDDVALGLERMIALMDSAEPPPPPIQFVSGRATTLATLAELALTACRSESELRDCPSRSFDVSRFVGSYARAQSILGWAPNVSLEEGVQRLTEDIRAEIMLSGSTEAAQ